MKKIDNTKGGWEYESVEIPVYCSREDKLFTIKHLKNLLTVSAKAKHTQILWPRNSTSRYKLTEIHSKRHVSYDYRSVTYNTVPSPFHSTPITVSWRLYTGQRDLAWNHQKRYLSCLNEMHLLFWISRSTLKASLNTSSHWPAINPNGNLPVGTFWWDWKRDWVFASLKNW